MLISEEYESLSAKNDTIFKAIFARKGNEKYLKDFLEALLKIKIKEIIVEEEKNVLKLSEEAKGGRIDLQAKLDNNKIINIEIQNRYFGPMIERTLVHGAGVLAQNSKKVKNYDKVPKVIMIDILNYTIFNFEEYISETELVLKRHKDYTVTDVLKMYFIELPKFRRQNVDMEEKINQWISFIDSTDRGRIKMAEDNNPLIYDIIVENRDILEKMTGDEKARFIELKMMWELDAAQEKYEEEQLMKKAEKRIKEALKNGLEKGIKEGRLKGLEEREKRAVEKNGIKKRQNRAVKK